MVINSQHFPALFEPKPLWEAPGWTGLGEVLACFCPALTRDWNTDRGHRNEHQCLLKPHPTARSWGNPGQRRFVIADLLKATS